MRDEPKSVLENVARLERENAELKARITERVAQEAREETIQTRARGKPRTFRFAAAVSLGLAVGLATLVMSLLFVPPSPTGSSYERDVRGGSAGVCR